MNYWLHRISHHSEISYHLLDNNILTIGYSEFVNKEFMYEILNGKNNKKYFETIFINMWGKRNHKTRHNLWRFLTEFKKNDWIVVPFSGTFDIFEIVSDKPEPIGSIKPLELKKWVGGKYKMKEELINLDDKPVDIGFFWKVKPIAKGISRNKYANKNLANKMRNLYTNAKISDIEESIKNALFNFEQNKKDYEQKKVTESDKNIFLTKIDIKNIRHLRNTNISLSDKKRKHIILTGKNGSGKTSVLEILKDYLQSFYESNQNIDKYRQQIIAPFNKNPKELINKGKFILSYFGAKRSGETLNIPKGISKFEESDKYSILDKSNKNFIQFLVNMKADRSFAKDDNNYETVKKIDEWFEMFNELLNEIFEDKDIVLKFDFVNYNFNILQTNRKPFDFSTLSDGYSAIFNIFTELMMRMERHKAKIYDLQGIVLIDEIETHLHVELQKKILPFLTSFFPNIQFVVTTHSPFILNSISNTVIYDLEKHIREEDFSAYAYDGIVETYLDTNKYSEITKNKLDKYKELLFKKNIQEIDKNELRKLEYYFNNIPAFVAPELISIFQNLQIQKLNKND